MATSAEIQRLAAGELPMQYGWVLLAFVIGCMGRVGFEYIGKTYIAELLLAAVGLLGLFSGEWRKVPPSMTKQLVVFYTLAVVGYVGSDLWIGTEFYDYIRGWARLVVLLSNLLGFTYLLLKERRCLLGYLAGLTVSYTWIAVSTDIGFSAWKFGWAEPITIGGILLAAMLGGTGGMLVCVVLGAANLWLDFKTMAIFCLVSAFGLAYQTWGRRSSAATRFILVAFVVPVSIASFVYLYGLTFDESDKGDRSREGSTERMAALMCAGQAIMGSPIIGYGSWAKDPQYAAYFIETRAALRGKSEQAEASNANWFEQDAVQAHSQALQAWTEGGVLAFLFFAWYGFNIFKLLYRTILEEDDLTTLVVKAFFLSLACWNVLFSPYAGDHRLIIGLALALVLAGEVEKCARIAQVKAKRPVLMRRSMPMVRQSG